MDQASIHTSDSLIEKLEEWEQKNLKIFWLPTYSPKQNLMEILWKFIKYEWIEIDSYSGWTSLHNYLKKVLDNFGTEYVINFVQALNKYNTNDRRLKFWIKNWSMSFLNLR